tara:strand:+ start:14733 stop:15188 length:456 start_codon:yes stop_codon:yes gene_type:complete
MSAIDNVRETLLAELEPVEREYTETKERLDAIEKVKNQLEALLKAMDGTKRANGKAANKASKPFARKSDVMEVCRALVAANQPIAKDDLESLTKHKLANDGGFNLSGVALRLAECLASNAFEIASDGDVSLASKGVAADTNLVSKSASVGS